MKIGIISVSMPEYDPIEAMGIVSRLGYEGIEWRLAQDDGDRSNPGFWSGNRTSMSAEEMINKAGELKKHAGELGIAFPSVAAYTDCLNLEVVELNMQASAAIGAALVRVNPPPYDRNRPYVEQLDDARRAYAKVAALAKQYGVRACIETHMGHLAPTIFKTMSLVGDLDPADVGILWDPANGIVEGSEVYSMALSIAGDYLAEVHVKNMKREAGTDEDGKVYWRNDMAALWTGCADWTEIIAALNTVEYDGWLMLEDFSTEQPTAQRMSANIDWLRKLL